MAKNPAAANSWLNVVKKAFRSPTKSTKSSKRREEHEQQDDEKKRGKRRWIFSKQCVHETTIQHCASASSVTDTRNRACFSNTNAQTLVVNPKALVDDDERRDITMAVAAVQAGVEVIRLSSPSEFTTKYFRAATVIQSAFRAYLARRALRALRGIVKLQALVRGQNIRKQAKMTLRCIQSLVRVQTRVRDQRRRLSYEGTKDSTFSVSSSLKDYRAETRISQSREGSSITDEWDCHQHTLEEIKAMLQKTKEAAWEHRYQLSTPFYRQTLRSGKDQFLCKEEKPGWSDHWKKIGRNSSDQRAPVKTVEIDTAQSCSESDCSPMHRTSRYLSSAFPITRRLQVHSASPRCLKVERNIMMAQSPTLSSNYHKMAGHENAVAASVPNYMAATASAMARSRSESTPRQRPLTPERGSLTSAKKRLSFAAPEPDACAVISDTELERNLSSPSSSYGTRGRSNTLLRGQP